MFSRIILCTTQCSGRCVAVMYSWQCILALSLPGRFPPSRGRPWTCGTSLDCCWTCSSPSSGGPAQPCSKDNPLMTDRVTRFVRSIGWSTCTIAPTQTSKSKTLIIKCRYKKTASVHKTSTIQTKQKTILYTLKENKYVVIFMSFKPFSTYVFSMLYKSML